MDLGEKIKNLRMEQGLTQEELAERCELTKGFISQIERNLSSPSVTSLQDILEALGTDLAEFFSKNHSQKIVFSPEDFFENINSELDYKIEWIVPNAQKNILEPVIITLNERGESKEVTPFEGEVFGYVLFGEVILITDQSEYKLKKGNSFYFSAKFTHKLRNNKNKKAAVLWITTPPSF
ncbi:MAG: XRE family transcriptional regulator [Tissierellia bacterium]|nr:XRE family transcriptional regulator [Tissierellia bacterium]